jgi:serine protease
VKPLFAAILLGLLLVAPGEVVAQAETQQVIVKYRSPVSTRKSAEAAARVRGKVSKVFGRGKYALIDVPADTSAAGAAGRLKHLSEIEAAAPNFIRRVVSFPNDPQLHSHQWALNSYGQNISFPIVAPSVPDADIDAPEAWDITTGSASVVVAVIDTGLALTNADLAPNAWVNDSEIPGNSIDDDGNGYVDDVNGYNFSAHVPSPEDDNGHGTFVSGIIGARGDNGAGISGVNWRVSLMALKAFNAAGTGTDADLIEAIDYAVQNGAKVINASWGDPAYSSVLLDVIKDAGDAGVFFVAAAGNDGNNLREHPFYPAAYALENLVTVGSTNYQDKWSAFSNYDSILVDVFAPGESVYSTRPTFNSFGNGTSYAAPHVTGIAALLAAQNRLISPDEMRRYIISAVDQRQTLDRRAHADGRVSAHKALASHTSPIQLLPLQSRT